MTIPVNEGKELLTLSKFYRAFREYKNYSFVFVEGSDDKRFWDRFSAELCEIIESFGRDKVIEALSHKSRIRDLQRRVAGIVDPDYELIDPTGKLLVDDLLYDDVPDLENMIVSRKIIANAMLRPGPFGNVDDADKFAEDWLNAALQLSMDYGYFRLVAKQRRNFGLVPNSIESAYSDCVDFGSLRLKCQETAELVVERSPNVTVSVNELLEAVKAMECRYERSRLLVRGKDLLNFMLCVCLPVFNKTNGDESVRVKLEDWLKVVRDSDELFRRLQGKYQCEDLKCTKLHGRIQNWECANEPYRILKPEI